MSIGKRLSRVVDSTLSPNFMRWFNFWIMLFFIVQVPLITTPLKNSVPYLVAISIWANIAGHLSAWQSSRVEERQEGDENVGTESGTAS